jgi:hypothetical protein
VFRWLHGLTRKAKARDPRIYYMVKRSAHAAIFVLGGGGC